MNYFSHIAARIAFHVRKRLYLFLQALPSPERGNKLLIVRLDAIGDYILFRNCIHQIHQSDRFKNFEITLLGNQLWRDLAEGVDKDVVDKFLWIDPKIIYNQSDFTLQKLLLFARLKFSGFQVTLHPVHSRMMEVDRFLAELKTGWLIGSMGDEINYPAGEKAAADKLYNELIPVQGYSTFEFSRNVDFLSGITGIPHPGLQLKMAVQSTPTEESAIVIAPGAGHERRKWQAANFGTVIRTISKTYPQAFFYICGTATDKGAAHIIKQNTADCNVIDMTGELSLLGFAQLMKRSRLVLSNESSAIHLAAALDIPAVCLSNGNMFGRFNPYPVSMGKNIITIYSDEAFYDSGLFKSNVEKTRVFSSSPISQIHPDQVAEHCIGLLRKTVQSV